MPSIDYQYSVRTQKFSTLVQGFDSMADAEAGAKLRNKRAEELCLTVRYEATNIPASRSKKEG